MEIFNIGPLEFLLIAVIALIVLGPEEMMANARRIGKWVSKVVRSPMWREVVGTSKELRDLPNKIMREAQMEETVEELKKFNTSRISINDLEKEAESEIPEEMKSTGSAPGEPAPEAVEENNKPG